MSERVPRLTLVFAVVTALLTGLGSTGQVEDSPIGPDYEDPTEVELAFYDSEFPCPPIEGLQNSARFVTVDDQVEIKCDYRVDETSPVQTFRVAWHKTDYAWYASYLCTDVGERQDDGTRIRDVINDDLTMGIRGEYALDRGNEFEAGITAALRELMVAVTPYSRTCAEFPVALDCPEVSGHALRTPGEPDELQPDTFEQSCFYEASSDVSGDSFRIEVWWAAPRGVPQLYDRLCNELPSDGVGVGVLVAPGIAANATYWRSSPLEGPDVEVARGAAQDLLDQAGSVARSCDGAEVLLSNYQPFPDYLDEQFSPALTTGSSGGSGGGLSSLPSATPSGGPSDGGFVQTLIRIGSVVMFGLSILGLFITFLLVRRETRIREKRDLLRIGITLGVAILSVLIIGRHAPLWAILVAVGLGIALGTWQGSSLIVRNTGRGLVGKRSMLAVVAFAVGILLMQVAGLLNRSGGVTLGIAVSFLSAAITAGLFIGRKPRMVDALGEAAKVIFPVVFGIGLVAGFGVAAGQAQTDPNAPAPGTCDHTGFGLVVLAGCEGYESLLDVVPWDTAFVTGGLWSNADKPPAPISLPRGLTVPPDPVTRTVSWINADSSDNQTAYELTETYSFGTLAEGGCCSVLYEAAGTETTTRASDGEVTVDTTEVSGRLDDVQPFGTIGLGGEPLGIPFSEVLTLSGMPEESCQRVVAWLQEDNEEGAAIWDSLVVNGEAQSIRVSPWSFLFIDCDLPDFTYENAFALAPPIPAADDPVRVVGAFAGDPGETCPVRQEFFRLVWDAGLFEGVQTATLADLFLEPNAPQCDYGGLFDPPSFGQGGRGGTRHEIIYRLAILNDPVAEAARLADDEDTFYSQGRTTSIPLHRRCEVGPDGVPLQPTDESACRYISIHSIDDSGGLSSLRQTGNTLQTRNIAGGVVYIETDWDTRDGPNVTVRAHLPWGKYIYRCHYCTPGSAAISKFIRSLHNFGVSRGRYDPAFDEEPAAADPTTETTEADPRLTEPSEFTPAGEEEEGITTEEAGLIGLVGLIGSIGLLGASLQGTGLSPADIASAVRRGDLTGGVADAPDEPPDVPEEDGEPPETSEEDVAAEDGEPPEAPEEDGEPAPPSQPPAEDQPDADSDTADDVAPAPVADAGLAGLPGGARLIGQTLVEAGVPAEDVMEAWREDGTDGVRDLAAAKAAQDGYPEPPPPPPEAPGGSDAAVTDSAEIEEALKGVPEAEIDNAEAELVQQLEREKVEQAIAAARAAVGELPEGDIGEVLDRPAVQQELEGLTDDQRRRAVQELIQRLTSERSQAAVDTARAGLDIPTEEGPLAGQPRGDIGELVQSDEGAREALERLSDDEVPDGEDGTTSEFRTARDRLIDDLTEGRRAQATSEAIEAVARAVAVEDIEKALDAGDARTVREILDGLDPEVANRILEEVQQGRPPIDLEAMEGTQPPDLTSRTSMTGVPEGDVFDTVNGNERVREILERLPNEERDVVVARTVTTIGHKRTEQVVAAVVEAARRPRLVVAVRAAVEAGDSDAVNDLLDGLDPTARGEVLEAAGGAEIGSHPPPGPGGPSIPDPDVGLEVDAALAQPDASSEFDRLPAEEQETARAAARAQLEAIRRQAILRTARRAVPPRDDDVPWRDPYETSRGEEVRRALDEAHVPEDDVARAQGDLEQQLQAEERRRVQEVTAAALRRDRAVEALRHARQVGDATGVDRILTDLSDQEREAVLRRFD